MTTAVFSGAQEEGSSVENTKSSGLVDAHAYSLISVREVKNWTGEKVRLMRVRNPWGKKEWTGAYSDGSKLWTSFMRKQVPEYSEQNDGCFFITFKDYCAFFYVTSICQYQSEHQRLIAKDQLDSEDLGMCLFDLEEDAFDMLSITLNQTDQRFTDETMNGQYGYAQMTLVCTRLVDNTQHFLDGEQSAA